MDNEQCGCGLAFIALHAHICGSAMGYVYFLVIYVYKCHNILMRRKAKRKFKELAASPEPAAARQCV